MKKTILISMMTGMLGFGQSAYSANIPNFPNTTHSLSSQSNNNQVKNDKLYLLNERPFYINGTIYSIGKIKKLFKVLYTHQTGDATSKILDIVRIKDNITAVVLKTKDIGDIGVQTYYTDGKNYFKNLAPNSSINEDLATHISQYYSKILSHKKTTPISSPVKLSVKDKKIDVGLNQKTQIPESLKKEGWKSYDPKLAKKSAKNLQQHFKKLHQYDAMDKYVQKHLLDTTPVFLDGYDPKKPTLFEMVSWHCYFCKKLMKDYQENKSLYKKINVGFIPLGHWIGEEDKWKNYFHASDLKLTEQQIVKNNVFFKKAIILSKIKNIGTPTNLWLSKQYNGKYFLISGQIPINKINVVIHDMMVKK